MKEVTITSEYITLGQFLKFVGIIENGAYAKAFLQEQKVLINGVFDQRRGRKLYPNDQIEVLGRKYSIVK